MLCDMLASCRGRFKRESGTICCGVRLIVIFTKNKVTVAMRDKNSLTAKKCNMNTDSLQSAK